MTFITDGEKQQAHGDLKHKTLIMKENFKNLKERNMNNIIMMIITIQMMNTTDTVNLNGLMIRNSLMLPQDSVIQF